MQKLLQHLEKDYQRITRKHPQLAERPDAPFRKRILPALFSAPLKLARKASSLLGRAEQWKENLDHQVEEKQSQSTPESLSIIAVLLFLAIAAAVLLSL